MYKHLGMFLNKLSTINLRA